MTNNLLRNLNGGLGRLDKFQQQLASGKRVLLPSDDPAAVTTIQRLRTSLMETEQYKENVNDAYSWLDSTDTVLESLTSVLHRVREIATYGANGTLDEENRVALSHEVEQIFDNVLQLSNSTHGGKYLFAGQMTTTTPFERVSNDPTSPDYLSVRYLGGYIDQDGTDLASIKTEIGVNSTLTMNIVTQSKTASGEVEEQLFAPILQTLAQVHHSLSTNDSQTLSTTDLEALEKSLDTVLRHRSEIGAKMNRIEMSKERLDDLKVNFTSLLSDAQDVDVAETVMLLKSAENTYRIALSVGARIIQPTLVDFLR
jgi:flagellar hook-associated protein 3 FlgL